MIFHFEMWPDTNGFAIVQKKEKKAGTGKHASAKVKYLNATR